MLNDRWAVCAWAGVMKWRGEGMSDLKELKKKLYKQYCKIIYIVAGLIMLIASVSYYLEEDIQRATFFLCMTILLKKSEAKP